MKVLMLAIASEGEQYSRMKAALTSHYLDSGLSWLDLRFVYAGHASDPRGELDLVYPQLEESMVPGIFDKTVLALSEMTGDYDFIVRTNMSTWFHWDLLHAYLLACPRNGLLAGCAPTDKQHVSGYCIIMSADVADVLVQRAPFVGERMLDGVAITRLMVPDWQPGWMHLVDDVEISRLLMPDFPPHWVHKVDMYDGGKGLASSPGADMNDVFVFRHKSDRALDAASMKALSACYARGLRGVRQLLGASYALVQVSGSGF